MTSYIISTARLLLLVSISTVAFSRNVAENESSVLRYSILEETGPGTKYVGDLLMDIATLHGITNVNSTPVPATTNRKREQMALLPGKYQHLFSIDPLSGVLMTRGPIDRESVCTESSMTSAGCVLNVEVAVIRPVESFRAFNVQITVEDINDNPPKFDQEHYSIHISETALPEVGVYPLPSARDIDWGRFSVQSYVLRPSGRNDTFALRVMSDNLGDGGATNNVGLPSLILMKSLDYETRSRYELELVAFDGGRPRKFGTLAISVIVIDANDNSPQFDQKSYETTVLETADPSVPIIRVQAKDNDDASNGRVSYRLTDQSREQHGNLFKINNITGEISLVRRFDTEYRDIYVLVVAADDAGSEPRSSIVRVTINVEDVNQHPPTVTIDPLTQSGRAEVVENQPVDEFVAYVSAEDADRGVNGQVICNVTSEIFSMHLVHRNLYKLTTAVTFDREAVDRYIAVVRCTDLGTPSLASTHGIEVHVQDDNDNIPQFSRRVFEVGVMENSPAGRSVLTVSAWDIDVGLNSELRYSLTGYNNSTTLPLNIDPVTGMLTVGMKALDHELTADVELIVTASDQGNPVRSATTTVRVSVLNENDCTPGFTQSTFSFGIFENLPPETEVGTVSAIDPDMPPYNDFFYLLQTSSLTKDGDPSFIVDSVTGKITTSIRLDREQTSVYYLKALAIDSHNASLVTSVDVTVYVADKNDNQPYIIFPSASNNTVHVSTYASVGYTVTRILASDADISVNAMLVYSLLFTATVPPTEMSTSSNDLAGRSSPFPFDVDANNGAVYLTRSLRQSISRDYVVVVTVSDRGSPVLSTSATLIVRVNDSLSYAISQSLLSSTGGVLGGTTGDGGSGKLVSLFDFAFNQQVLVVMAAVTAIVVMLLVAAIVFVRRRQLQQRERHCGSLVAKETVGLSSSSTPTSVALPTVSGDVTTQGWAMNACSLTQYNHTCNISDVYSPGAITTYTQPLMQQPKTTDIPFDMQVGVPADMGDDSLTDASITSDSGRGQSESDDLAYYNQSMSTFLPRSTQFSTPSSGVLTSSSLPMVTSTSLTVGNGSVKHSANCDNYCSFTGHGSCCAPRTHQHHYGNNLSLIDDVRKPIGVKTYSIPPGGTVTLTSNQPSFDGSHSIADRRKPCNVITPSINNDVALSADRCQTLSAASPSLGRQHRTLDKTTNLNHPISWLATSSVGLAHPLVTVRVAPLIATAVTSGNGCSRFFDTTNTKQSSHPRRRLPPLPPVLVASARQEPMARVSRPSYLHIEEKIDPDVVMSTTSNTDSIATVGSEDGASSTSGSFVMHLQAAQQHRQQQQQQLGNVFIRPDSDRRVCISDL